MRRMIVSVLVIGAFVLGVLVGTAVRPQTAAAAVGSVQSWGLIEDPSGQPHNVLLLFDSSTGEVWGYPEKGGLRGTPVRIGALTKVGAALGK
jgi:hypothetical protein